MAHGGHRLMRCNSGWNSGIRLPLCSTMTFRQANPGTPTGLTLTHSLVLTAVTNPGGITQPYLCLDNGSGGFTTLQHQKLGYIFGVTPADQTRDGRSWLHQHSWPDQLDPFDAPRHSIQENSVALSVRRRRLLAICSTATKRPLRVDYNWNANNRLYINYNYLRETDKFGPGNIACTRGLHEPAAQQLPGRHIQLCAHLQPDGPERIPCRLPAEQHRDRSQ